MTTVTQDLASRLRPKSLDQVIGQDSIKPLIRTFIDKECQRWLFYGPSGTGKTSLAYIVARELGTQESSIIHPICADLNPSGMRDLAGIQTYPISGKYHVIILDEVQHLSKTAQSVLFKPLEQEESPVVWILCTMEVSKLDKALRDRCVQFPVKEMGTKEHRELVWRAADQMKYTGDTSTFIRMLEIKHVGSAREILRAFEMFCNGMSAEDAIGE